MDNEEWQKRKLKYRSLYLQGTVSGAEKSFVHRILKIRRNTARSVEKKRMEELIAELENIIKDINVTEIADHLNEESLWNWCGAWRQEANNVLEEMKKIC